jgi:hypothetical protein
MLLQRFSTIEEMLSALTGMVSGKQPAPPNGKGSAGAKLGRSSLDAFRSEMKAYQKSQDMQRQQWQRKMEQKMDKLMQVVVTMQQQQQQQQLKPMSRGGGVEVAEVT